MSKLNLHSRKAQIVISIPIDEFAAGYFKIIDKKLEESYIFNRHTEGNKIRFKGSMFRFVWNGWNVFNPISSGEIQFTEEKGKPFISHKIYFNEALVIALIFNIIPLFTLKFDPWLSLLVFAGIWTSYALNYFITVFRFISYISNVLIEINEEHGYKLKTEVPAFG